MKAIFCIHCRDLVAIRDDIKRPCECGKTWGRKTSDPGVVEVSPDVLVIGIPEREFQRAINAQPDEGRGLIFPTFLMPRKCNSVITTQ